MNRIRRALSIRTVSASLSSTPLLCLLLMGCTAQTSTPEPVGGSAQELAPTCQEPPPDQYVTMTGTSAGATVSAETQQLAGYNTSSSPCGPNMFDVQVDGALGRSFVPFAAWAGPAPTDKGDCDSSYVGAQLWGYIPGHYTPDPEDPQWVNPEWYEISGTKTSYATWQYSPLTRRFSCATPPLFFPEIVGSSYSEIVVAAWVDVNNVPDVVDVQAGVEVQ
jgi:hypothetical protein